MSNNKRNREGMSAIKLKKEKEKREKSLSLVSGINCHSQSKLEMCLVAQILFGYWYITTVMTERPVTFL